MTDSDRDLAALQAVLNGLTVASVCLHILSEDLSHLQRETRNAIELQLDRKGQLVSASYWYAADNTEGPSLQEDELFLLRSHCEWLPKRVAELHQSYIEAEQALAALPRRLDRILSRLVRRPWTPRVRLNCLDKLIKWPGEMYGQSSYASIKVSGNAVELLKKAAKRDPFPTWAHFERLLARYKDELYAIRGEVLNRAPSGPADAATEGVGAADELVTLDQIAPLAALSKRTLERQFQNGAIPEPDVRGGGGRAHKWSWSKMREPLSKIAGRELPERFPGSRII